MRNRAPLALTAKLEKLSRDAGDLRINLSDHVNTSAVSAPTTFSLDRTHLMFRSLGLRHLGRTDTGRMAVRQNLGPFLKQKSANLVMLRAGR